jgi:DNA-binding SARP family transcriptional activator/tetratricopeptide (TPR) repeat protein
MRFRVLGPVRVWSAECEVGLGSPKQRLICGVLALEANRLIAVDTLVELLWPENAPNTARRTLQAYVSRLRTSLAASSGDAAVAVIRRGGGYELVCDPDLVDAHRFQRLVGQARGAADETGAELLREALALWQGPPLADVADEEFRERRCRGLLDARLAAVEQLAETELRLGRHERLVEELTVLAREHPDRQRLVGALMLALHRSGRGAQALRTFETTRRLLASDLGIDPSPDLRRAYQEVLRDGPRVTVEGARHRPAPAQLPADVGHFTGREPALAELDALLEQTATALPMAVITGTAGVGKTALAVHWGHRVRSRFQDGQLYVNLRGFDAEGSARPIDALARFLLALGCPPDQVPAEVEPASDAYRTLLADRRVLVVLDNASTADQVRPLLPGSGGCAVLVTSRNRLRGLVARDGGRLIRLDVLSEPEGELLLRRVVGAHRVNAEPDAAGDLVRLCVRLPLALRIVAANLLDRPWENLAGHVAGLQTGDRMDALAVGGDADGAVRNAFGLSYRTLPEGARRMFRLLGLVPALDVSVDAAAALADAAPADAARLLDELTAAHLLQQDAPGRFWFHDLLRLYAVERATIEDSQRDRRAAVERLLWWYECAGDAAARVLYPQRLRLEREADGTASPAFAGEPAALAWLDSERDNLVLAVEHAASHGPKEVAWRLADTLRGYFWLRMHTVDWLRIGTAGVAAAQAEGGPTARAAAEFNLGDALVRQSQYRQAAGHFARALTLAEEIEWTPMRSAALGSLGSVHLHAGEPRAAQAYLMRALDLARAAGSRFTEAVILGGLAVAHRELGDLDESADAFDETIKAFAECGVRQAEMSALAGLGQTYHAMGDLDRAADSFMRALTVLRELGDRSGESDVLPGLAAIELARDRPDVAYELATTALDLAGAINDRRAAAHARNVLGAVHRAAGRHTDAVQAYLAVLDHTTDSGDLYPHVDAQVGLAETYNALDRPDLAAAHAHRAVRQAEDAGYRLLADRARELLSRLA